MKPDALTLLCAELQCAVYDPAFLEAGVLDLSRWGRTQIATLWSDDPRIGKVRHGFVSYAPTSIIWTFAGTLAPGGSMVEWLDDFKALLTPSPWHPGDKVHQGFLEFFQSMTIEDTMGGVQPLEEALNLGSATGHIFHGHSLGTATATFAALIAKGNRLTLFAAPKPGDRQLAQSVRDAVPIIESYANTDDVVPKVPLTIDWPFTFEDFQPVVQPVILNPASVTPRIPSDWANAHHMPNYLQMIRAIN